MRFDLHVHSSFSYCSNLDIETILTNGRAMGLDGVCITDHQTMDAARYCREGIQPDGLCVIFGMEYSTDQGDFLIFGPFEGIRSGLSAQDLLRNVEKAGGVAIAAHPFRQGRSVERGLINKGLCRIVEGINGRNSRQENHKALAGFRDRQVRFVGGSDAHRLEELGKVPTTLTMPVTTRQDFIHALRDGRFELYNMR